MITHVVQPGENLYSIAARYGVSVQQVMRANGLTDPNLIFVGTVLRIPLSSAPPIPPGPGFPPPPPVPGGRPLERRVAALENQVRQIDITVDEHTRQIRDLTTDLRDLQRRVRRLEGR